MSSAIQPFHLLVIAVAGWLNRQQQVVIDYLIEENRVLKKQVEGQRLRFTDEQRMRLAMKAKGLGRQLLDELETLVTPDTLLAWHRNLIAQKVGLCQEGTRSTTRLARDHRFDTPHGEREYFLGLRPNPRRTRQSWSRDCTQHSQEYSEKAWHRAST